MKNLSIDFSVAMSTLSHMNKATTIAETIRQQIGINTLMCIGAHAFQALPETDKTLGGLQFKLGRNPKMKIGGYVTVTLGYSDTYTVRIVSSRGKVMLEASDVYCDMLGGQSGIIEGVTG
jgi:hypothetical protein